MTMKQPSDHSRHPKPRFMWVASLLGLLSVQGCSPVDSLMRGRPVAVVAVTTSAQTSTPASTPTAAKAQPELSLAAIVNHDLQHGHFAEGRQALETYLTRHPGNRYARSLLHQLTADPQKVLGRPWRAHVVQSGESYSALAARYLGDPKLFLILARYNHAADPSALDVGTTVRLPISAKGSRMTAVEQDAKPAREGQQTSDSPTARAEHLQATSIALLDQGHRQRALEHLDKALTLDPKLKPDGVKATALRQQLLSSYHERAIVLYRDQKLDKAIALWNHVLEIDPYYEPAIAYRARALELKRRLKQF